MTPTATQNAEMLNAIEAAGNSYTVRRYAGAWTPVIVVNGKRETFAQCATSGAAMTTAIRECAKASGWVV